MKNLILTYIVFCCLFAITALKAQDKAQALIIQTTSQAEVNKILECLKGQDPATYKLTISTTDKNGRLQSKTYGTAAIGSLQKIGGIVRPVTGGINANDLAIVGKKNDITVVGRDLQNKIISMLDKQLTRKSIQSIRLNTKNVQL